MKRVLIMAIILFAVSLIGVAKADEIDKDQQIDLLRIALERSRNQNTKCEEDFASLGSSLNKIMKQFRETTKELEELKNAAKKGQEQEDSKQ